MTYLQSCILLLLLEVPTVGGAYISTLSTQHNTTQHNATQHNTTHVLDGGGRCWPIIQIKPIQPLGSEGYQRCTTNRRQKCRRQLSPNGKIHYMLLLSSMTVFEMATIMLGNENRQFRNSKATLNTVNPRISPLPLN